MNEEKITVSTVQVDSEGQIDLGEEYAGCSFIMVVNEDESEITLTLLKTTTETKD